MVNFMGNIKKITVKDIALHCNVSKALAAAVLSDTKNNIGCSAAKREKILLAAKALNYRPNRLARAMRTGVVPLIAVCVHHIKFQDDEINLYLHDLLPNITSALQAIDFNTIFIPYDTIEDFMEQTVTLANDNLIAGIITNFPPEHRDNVIEHLKKTNLPYVMFGKITDDSVPHIHIDYTVLSDKLTEYASDHGFTQTVRTLAKQNIKNELYWETYLLTPNHEKCKIEDFDKNDQGTLWVASGEFTRRILIEEGISEKNIISIENKRVLIQSRPTVFVRNKDKERAAQAAGLIEKWIKTGKCPAKRQKIIKIQPNDIEFIL
jgi:hypothetical protein